MAVGISDIARQPLTFSSGDIFAMPNFGQFFRGVRVEHDQVSEFVSCLRHIARRPETAARCGLQDAAAVAPAFSISLFHFVNLVGNEAVRLAVDALGSLFVRGLDQAEDGAAALVKPVLLIADVIRTLGSQVLLVRLSNPFWRCAVYLLVDVHIKWHLISLQVMIWQFPVVQFPSGIVHILAQKAELRIGGSN
jgi:hypothetical protein